MSQQPTNPGYILSPPELKMLMQDVEATGLLLSVVKIGDIMKSKSSYGRRGAGQRRAFQYRWNNLKNVRIDKYVKILVEYQVEPCAARKLEHQNFLLRGGVDNDKEVDLCEEFDNLTFSDNEEEEKNTKPTPAAAARPVQTPPPEDKKTEPTPAAAAARPVQTPTHVAQQQIKTPPRRKQNPQFSSPYSSCFNHHSPNINKIMVANANKTSNEEVPASSQGTVSSLGTFISTSSIPMYAGSVEMPHLCLMDLDFPERTRDFNPQFVGSIERHGWSRRGIHIRKTVPPPDWKLWTATIPSEDSYSPEYQNKCVLVKGPSRDFFQRNTDIYSQKITCDATVKAHKSTEIQIKNTTREWTYYLLVFPEEIDNAHFVQDGSKNVPTIPHPITVKHNNKLNTFGKELRTCCVYWEVAYKNGGNPLESATQAVSDESKFFD
jgi:hypothetical protein